MDFNSDGIQNTKYVCTTWLQDISNTSPEDKVSLFNLIFILIWGVLQRLALSFSCFFRPIAICLSRESSRWVECQTHWHCTGDCSRIRRLSRSFSEAQKFPKFSRTVITEAILRHPRSHFSFSLSLSLSVSLSHIDKCHILHHFPERW